MCFALEFERNLSKPDFKGSPSEYALFVTDCVAFEQGNKIILIDESGCPTDTTIFDGFYPSPGTDHTVLRAAFQGFRFQQKQRVNINCNVNFCYKFCQPVKNSKNFENFFNFWANFRPFALINRARGCSAMEENAGKWIFWAIKNLNRR